MKAGSDNFRQSAIWEIINRIKENGIEVVIFEPKLEPSYIHNFHIEHDFHVFKNNANIILANRMVEELLEVQSKVFTRDLFGVD